MIGNLNLMHRYRIFKLLNFFIPFLAACLIYLFFRHDIIIARYEEWLPLFGKIRSFTYIETGNIWYWSFFKYYLPDMLWAYSLGCSAFYGYRNRVAKIFIPILIGTTIEVLQYVGLLFGTGDIFDIIVEIIGSVTAYFVCCLGKKHWIKLHYKKLCIKNSGHHFVPFPAYWLRSVDRKTE